MNTVTNKGLFITFEGPEGAGKSTQVKLIYDFLVKSGHPCVLTREPGGTPTAEILRAIVKRNDLEEKLCDKSELLLMAASRAQHVEKLIRPSLESGKIVICDRFSDSTVAYQGFARGQNIPTLKEIINYATGGLEPDLTILLDISQENSFSRVSSRNEQCEGGDRFEAEKHDFHKKVRDGFLKLAEENPSRIKLIDARQPIEIIHNIIKGLIANAAGTL